MNKKPGLALVYVSLGIVVFIAVFPYFWLFLTSFKYRIDIFAIPPVWIFEPTMENYYQAFVAKGYVKELANSLIVAVSSTICSLVAGSLAAYGFSRYKLKGDNHMFFFILAVRMSPAITGALPYYLMFSSLGLLDTLFVVTLAHTTFNLPFVTWMLKGFFDEIPRDLDEAASIDGSSPFLTFLRIVLPVVSSGIVATAIFAFILSWNEFLYAMILTGYHARTLPVAIPGLVTPMETYWGQIAAVGVVTTLPVFIFALLTQRYIIRGLTFGAVKG